MHINTKIQTIAKIIGGIILAALSLETLLFIFDNNFYAITSKNLDSGLFTYVPNLEYPISQACFNNTVVINSAGFHSRDFVLAKPVGTERILVLGDSFTEGVQVPVANLYTTKLEALLNADPERPKTEVIPIAFSANGAYLDYLYLKAFGLRYKPDTVILVLGAPMINELIGKTRVDILFDKSGLIRTPKNAAPQSLFAKLRASAKNSRLVMNLAKRYGQLIEGAHIGGWKVVTPKTGQEELGVSSRAAGELEDKIFYNFARMATEHNFKVIIVANFKTSGQPEAGCNLLESENNLTPSAVPKLLACLAKKHGFDFFDLGAAAPLTFSCDAHWNRAGHEAVAKLLYQYLSQR